MKDTTTVRITVRARDEPELVARLGVAPDSRQERAKQRLVDLRFAAWDSPACVEFDCDGIPFLGFHREGTGYEPHRMCGDGNASLEIYCDREARLYVVIDETTGLPNEYSSKSVAEFLAFERECARRLAE